MCDSPHSQWLHCTSTCEALNIAYCYLTPPSIPHLTGSLVLKYDKRCPFFMFCIIMLRMFCCRLACWHLYSVASCFLHWRAHNFANRVILNHKTPYPVQLWTNSQRSCSRRFLFLLWAQPISDVLYCNNERSRLALALIPVGGPSKTPLLAASKVGQAAESQQNTLLLDCSPLTPGQNETRVQQHYSSLYFENTLNVMQDAHLYQRSHFIAMHGDVESYCMI